MPAPPRPVLRRTLASPLAVTAAVIVGLVLSLMMSLAIGSQPLSPATVVEALVAPRPTAEHAIVLDGRVPRTLAGVVVGAALGAAGALMQALTRNPLAEPGLLGVNAGASLAVVVAAALAADRGPVLAVASATIGALLATVAVAILGARAEPVRLALAGVALSAVLLSIARVLAFADPHSFDRLRAWQLGSIDIRDTSQLVVAAPVVAVGLILGALLGRPLDALDLGEDTAASLGANVRLIRALTLLAIALTAGAATAIAGGIAFVGLLAPHLVRRFVGRHQGRIVLASMPVAAILVLLADVAGRVVLRGEMPVGVSLALVGGPALIAVARSRGLRSL